MDNNIQNFIEVNYYALLEEASMVELPEPEKEAIYKLFKETVLTKLRLHLESLVESKEELETLDKATEHPDILIEYFANKKEVNFAELLAQFSYDTKQELLHDIAYLRGAIDAKQSQSIDQPPQ